MSSSISGFSAQGTTTGDGTVPAIHISSGAVSSGDGVVTVGHTRIKLNPDTTTMVFLRRVNETTYIIDTGFCGPRQYPIARIETIGAKITAIHDCRPVDSNGFDFQTSAVAVATNAPITITDSMPYLYCDSNWPGSKAKVTRVSRIELTSRNTSQSLQVCNAQGVVLVRAVVEGRCRCTLDFSDELKIWPDGNWRVAQLSEGSVAKIYKL